MSFRVSYASDVTIMRQRKSVCGSFPTEKYKRMATFSKKLLFCGSVSRNRGKNSSYFVILFRGAANIIKINPQKA